MKLTILNCENKNQGLYSVLLRHGENQFTEEVTVSNGVVPYLKFSDPMLEILHKNVGAAKNMNQFIFKIHRSEKINFPVEVGEF